ncbi:hypothetical protein P167DRAFT_576009 [Morchella conica CCBAS932]|uniref:Uncharacterized protein n=1 Tax=Morchella conica CCBAS932 TaxID=1392247 RepID=A0A3N4KQN7_9PEZI|nr:hypothetical protein P167DRAFT_576009 [Morchella conica CCBAS932]
MSDPVYSMFLKMASSDIMFEAYSIMPGPPHNPSTPQLAPNAAITSHLPHKRSNDSGQPPAKRPCIPFTVGSATGVAIGIGVAATTPAMMDQNHHIATPTVSRGQVPNYSSTTVTAPAMREENYQITSPAVSAGHVPNGSGKISTAPATTEQSHCIVYTAVSAGRVPSSCGRLAVAPTAKNQSPPIGSTAAVPAGRAPNGGDSSVAAVAMKKIVVYTTESVGNFINGSANSARTPVTQKENTAPTIRCAAVKSPAPNSLSAALSASGKAPTPRGVAPPRNAAPTLKTFPPSGTAGGKALVETPIKRESVVHTSGMRPEMNVGSNKAAISINRGLQYNYTPCTSEEMEKAMEPLRPVVTVSDAWMLEAFPSMQSRPPAHFRGERSDTIRSAARATNNIAPFSAPDPGFYSSTSQIANGPINSAPSLPEGVNTAPYDSICQAVNGTTNTTPSPPVAIDTAFIGSISRIAKAASNSAPFIPPARAAATTLRHQQADAASQTPHSLETGFTPIVTRPHTANAANNTPPPPPDPAASAITTPLTVDAAANTTSPPTCTSATISTQTPTLQTSNAATNTAAVTIIEIEGHVYNVPTDPVQFFHVMRREILASYRALMDKSGTLRDFHMVWSSAKKRAPEEMEGGELEEVIVMGERKVVKRRRVEVGTGNEKCGGGVSGSGRDEDFCAPKD